jgi:hypothetical protein
LLQVYIKVVQLGSVSAAAQSLTGFIVAHLPDCIEPDWLLDKVKL